VLARFSHRVLLSEWAGMSLVMAFTRQFHPSSVKVNVFTRVNWRTSFCLTYQSDDNVHVIDQNWARLAEEQVSYTFVRVDPSRDKTNLAIAICSSWIRIHYWRDLNDLKQIGITLFAKSSEVSLSHFRILCHRTMTLWSLFEYGPCNNYGSFDHSTSILLQEPLPQTQETHLSLSSMTAVNWRSNESSSFGV
jgi:hypothetical protein